MPSGWAATASSSLAVARPESVAHFGEPTSDDHDDGDDADLPASALPLHSLSPAARRRLGCRARGHHAFAALDRPGLGGANLLALVCAWWRGATLVRARERRSCVLC